jgi:hypothetical protein
VAASSGKVELTVGAPEPDEHPAIAKIPRTAATSKEARVNVILFVMAYFSCRGKIRIMRGVFCTLGHTAYRYIL